MKRLLNLLFFFSLFHLISCSEKYETISGDLSVFATPSSSTRTVGQETKIKVFTNEGEEVTDEAIIIVEGNPINGNTFVKQEKGSYEVNAQYAGISTPSFMVEYQEEGEVNFRKRILIEDYTGTWCGWCPRVSHAMKLVKNISDDIVFIAIHRAPTGTSDPYNYTLAEPLEQMINTPGYPKGFINRIHQWEFPEPYNLDQVIEFRKGSNPKLGLALKAKNNGNILDVEVKAMFANDFSNLKVVVQLLEDGLIWPQVNYTEFYDGQNPIQNYQHDYTLRKTLTPILGKEIPSNETVNGNVWISNYSTEIPENIQNPNLLNFVAFIVDENNEAINVRRVEIGETQEFEFD